jgi:putative ABC transport system permease protein
MLRLALRTLRFRKGSFLASLVVLFLGAMIVQACGGLLETGILSQVPPQRLAAAPIVITGDQDYPGHPNDDDDDPMTERVLLAAGLVDTVARVPGVAAAVPDVSVPLTVLGGSPVQASGYGFSSARLAPYSLTAGTAPAGADDVVVDSDTARQQGIRPGAELSVSVRGSAHRFRVTGLATAPTTHSAALLFTDGEATTLFDRVGSVDDIGVLPAPGVDVDQLRQRVESAVAGHSADVLTGDERGLAEFPDAVSGAENLIPLAAAFGGLATLVAIFVVGSTLALLMQQRRQEMALLRTVGATPGQLRRMVMAETLVVALVAAALAVVPGLGFGRWMYGVLIGHGLVPSVMRFNEGLLPRAVGFGVTLVSALVAALIASRRVSVIRPAEALAEATLQTRWLSPVRAVFAFLCLGGATALAIVTALVMTGPVAASTATPAAMLWAAGIALVSPGLARWLTAVLRWPLRWFTGLAGALAMRNARVRKVRLAAAMTPVMLVTGLATALIYLQTSQDDTSQQQYVDSLRADVVLGSATGALPPSLIDTVSRLPQVAGASAYVTSTGHLETPLPPGEDDDDDFVTDRVDEQEVPLQGISASGAGQTVAASLVGGSYADLVGDTVALPADVVAQPGRAIGDTVRMRWGDGRLSGLRVVASYTAPRGFESALVPVDLLLTHTTSGQLPEVLVKARAGVSAASLVSALHGIAGGVPGLQVATRADAVVAHQQGDETSAVISYLLAAVIIGYAVISLVNTLVVATSERRREFALQRLIGSTKAQVMRMMTVEAALTAVAGIVLGTAVAAGALVPFGLALDDSVLPSGPLWIYLAITGTAVVLTFLVTLGLASLTLRARPVEAAVAA